MPQQDITFSALKNIVLIGGGDLMAASAKIFKQLKFNVSVIAANRHINEALPVNGGTLALFCQQHNITQTSLVDINALSCEQLATLIPDQAMAICFGPAWVFKDNIIKQFAHGMFNINAIPIPHYLGGAHYSWQLLNNNREGGCFFQQISHELDQGDIFAKHKFTISAKAETPNDYFIENIAQGVTFIEQLAKNFVNGDKFFPSPYAPLNESRIYLPRLRTDKQAYINWQWHAKDVVSFCQGFDEPYLGAATLINGQVVRLKRIKAVTLTSADNEQIPAMHPFCSGIIIRKTKASIIVAANEGFIELTEVVNDKGICIKESLKEGMRLHTPQALIEQAMSYQVVINGQGFKD